MSPEQRRIDTCFMQQALVQAQRAQDQGEVPVGALVVLDGEITGTGHNRTATDADPTAHAEIVALRAAATASGQARLDGATLYVTIEPCLMCCGAILQARIKRLVFGAREPRTGAVISMFDTFLAPGHTHHVAVSEGVEAEAAGQLMRAFFQGRRAGR